jgi:hypothetical protein
MANRIRTGLSLSAAAVIAGLFSGCGSGSNHTDSQVPATNLTRNIAGVWRRYQIEIAGTRVTCPDPIDRLAPSTRELTVNSVVVDTCAVGEQLIIGAPTALGKGRYQLSTRRGVEEGSYLLSGTSLTLTRDVINGNTLRFLDPPLAPQKTVYAVSFADLEGTISITPIPQPVALQKVDSTKPAFTEDGRLIVTNLAPVKNADASVNTIVLPGIEDDATVAADLTVQVGPLAASGRANETPGFTRVRGVTNTFKFVPADGSTPQPTPGPAPTGS